MDLLLVMRAISATERGGTGVVAILRRSSFSSASSEAQLVTVDFDKSTRQGTGVLMKCWGVKVSKTTLVSFQTEPSTNLFFASATSACLPLTYPMQYASGVPLISVASNLCALISLVSRFDV